MIVVGIAGQIASGKSVVADVFAKQGAVVLSGDEIGREVVETDRNVLRRLTALFGKEILTPTGRLRRQRLGRLVFADPARTENLNEIVHPRLLSRLRQLIRKHRRRRDIRMVAVDAALIFDWRLERELDAVIVVETTIAEQVKRLKPQGLTEAEARDRIRRQIPKVAQRRLADLVIRNHGTVAELRQKALKAYKKLLNSVDKD